MPATRPRIVHAAVALSVLAAFAAAPALATEVEDRNQTAETPSDAVEAGEGVIAGKWFWGGWYGWGHYYKYNYWSYYPYYCNYWNYGYGGYYGYGAYKSAASGQSETPKKVTAADAAARAAETRARRESLTETARSDAEIESGVSNERLAVESRARERASERASAERAGVATGCGDWLGVTPEQLAGAPANGAVVDDACCWPSGCALAASTECEDEGRACCAPDSERVEGCE